MKTPDEIARATAEKLVTIETTAMGWYVVEVGSSITTDAARQAETAQTRRERCVEHLTAGLLAAIEEALCQAPLPSPICDERMDHLLELWEKWETRMHLDNAKELVSSLVAERYFLRRVMADDVPQAASRIAHEKAKENERLRAALQAIAGAVYEGGETAITKVARLKRIARRALEEQP